MAMRRVVIVIDVRTIDDRLFVSALSHRGAVTNVLDGAVREITEELLDAQGERAVPQKK